MLVHLWWVRFFAILFFLANLSFAILPLFIPPMKLQITSGETPRYYVIIYFSWPKICFHSLEVVFKHLSLFKPITSDLSRNTYHTKLFVEILSSNTVFKSETTDPANHTIASRCYTAHCFARCCPWFTNVQQALSNTRGEDITPIS